jgi:hypothetical protein
MSADALASLRRLWRPARTDFTDSAYLPSTLAVPSPMPVFDRLADWLPYSGWLPEERLFLLERPPGRGATARTRWRRWASCWP